MEQFINFFVSIWDFSNALSIYILIGFFFAGVLHELVPQSLIEKHLGSDNVGSVVKATLFGIPLPVCSCSVIPLATGIKKSGASNGATLSFLISTPITGVDSILATFGMFGWAFTLYRIFSSILIAFVSGVVNNYLTKKEEIQKEKLMQFSAKPISPKSDSNESCCCECEEPKSRGFSINRAMEYGFITLFGDIAKSLFWGLIIGALIVLLIPENLSEFLTQEIWFSYLLAIAIAIPMYVCATASLPIAASLMLSGVSPGAAFVFLTAGPATNTITIGVVKKLFGNRALIIYLSTIMIGSILFGLGLDFLFKYMKIDITNIVHISEEIGSLEQFSSIVLWGMLLYFFAKSVSKKI